MEWLYNIQDLASAHEAPGTKLIVIAVGIQRSGTGRDHLFQVLDKN